jgi:hypothetical protein
MHRFINDIRKNLRYILTACRDSTGLILSEPSECMEPWGLYCHNLLTDPNIISVKITQELGEELEKKMESTEE